MRIILFSLAAFVCAVNASAQAPASRQIVQNMAFLTEVHATLDNRHAALLSGDNTSVAKQLLEVLSGPLEPPVKVGGGKLYSGCRLHSCAEKGAVILADDGRLTGAAVLYAGCAVEVSPICDRRERRLAVYVLGSIQSETRDALVDWGFSVADSDSLDVVTIESVPGAQMAVTVDFDGDGAGDRVRLEKDGGMTRLVAYRANDPDRGVVISHIRDPRGFYLRPLATTGTQEDVLFGTKEASAFVAHWDGTRFSLSVQSD